MDLEDQITFRQENLPTIAFAAFEDMRRNGELCDAVVKVGDRSFPVHRLITAARIPQFRRLFSEGETRGGSREVSLSNLDADCVEQLIKFAYTGQVTITDDNVRDLLTASCDLEVTQVEDACCEFASERLDVKNVMEFRKFGCDLSCLSLVEVCDRFVLQNFEDFSQVEEFLDLPFSYIKELTSRDDLQVLHEQSVFEAILKWVKVSPKDRTCHWPKLVENIRMSLLPVSYLKERVGEEQLIKESEFCKKLVEEAKDYHLMPDKMRMLHHFTLRPRR